jgi:hypothetical protein
MRDRRMGLARAGMVALLAALATVGGALAQNAAPKDKDKDKAKGNARGAAAAPAQPPRAMPGAIDPMAPDAQAKAGAPGTYHVTLKINTPDKTALAATYYPSKLGVNA